MSALDRQPDANKRRFSQGEALNDEVLEGDG
jgi:hypothetical protein